MYLGALVRLRAPEPRDADRLYELFNDAGAVAGLGVRYPVSRQAELDWVTGRGTPSYGSAHFAVETHDGLLLGTCGLFDTEWPENRSAQLGIALVDRSQWDKGYGTDTMRTLCRFGFEQMNLHRIELLVFASHTRAIRVYEKVGFVREAVARQKHWNAGWHDDVLMSLLEGELR
ncbi:MAG TPA: GNAT family protein [Frankiaceae bacterium]|nr:GNAT family protein [Frankiaceae bacterium]